MLYAVKNRVWLLYAIAIFELLLYAILYTIKWPLLYAITHPLGGPSSNERNDSTISCSHVLFNPHPVGFSFSCVVYRTGAVGHTLSRWSHTHSWCSMSLAPPCADQPRASLAKRLCCSIVSSECVPNEYVPLVYTGFNVNKNRSTWRSFEGSHVSAWRWEWLVTHLVMNINKTHVVLTIVLYMLWQYTHTYI